MKELMIMRHAQAAAEQAGGDFNRPLTPHGMQQIPSVAAACQSRKWHPALALVSPAVRTVQTAHILEQHLGKFEIITDPALYLATIDGLAHTLAAAPDEMERILLIGHNPGISSLACALANHSRAQTLPTAGFVLVQLPIKTWQHIHT